VYTSLLRLTRRSTTAWMLATSATASFVLLVALVFVPPAEARTATVHRAITSPQVLELADAYAVEIPGERYLHYGFTLRGGSHCVVKGLVLGLTGGEGGDVEVLLLGEQDFIEWNRTARSRTARIGHFHSARETATTLDVPLSEPGQYHLVISNVFSTATKVVQASAEITCYGAGEARSGL
jgi:hypothetical protein